MQLGKIVTKSGRVKGKTLLLVEIFRPNAKPAKPQVGNFQLQSQLKEIREKHNQQWRTTQLGRKRVWTSSDLEERDRVIRDTQAEWGGTVHLIAYW